MSKDSGQFPVDVSLDRAKRIDASPLQTVLILASVGFLLAVVVYLAYLDEPYLTVAAAGGAAVAAVAAYYHRAIYRLQNALEESAQ